MRNLLHNSKLHTLFICTLFTLLQACDGGSKVGGNEDTTAGTVSLTSLNSGGEVVGTTDITWDNTEPNRSSVVIELSNDSGVTFESIDDQIINDTGSYSFDTSTVFDCRNCRIRITATDVVGNVSEPAVSSQDFIINNVPQVLGSALLQKRGMNTVFGDEYTIVIPFDKKIELNTSVVSNAFFVPVLGDEIGPFSTMKLGVDSNEVVITINAVSGVNTNFHLHVEGKFDANKTYRTSPSGLDILNNLPGDIIFSPETGLTAEPLGNGIDIVPSFNSNGSIFNAASTTAVAVADLDENGALDIVLVNTDSPVVNSVYMGAFGVGFISYTDNGTQLGSNFPSTNTSIAIGDVDGVDGPDIIIGNTDANIVYYNNNTDGDFTTKATLSLGSAITWGVALGDIDGNGSLDLVTANDGANRVWRNNGSGVFTEDGTPQLLGTALSSSIILGDIDADNDLDIIVANGSNQPNKVYTNDGAGVFTDSGQSLGNSTTFSIALKDVDADGDLDLATGNDDTQTNKLWLNNGSGVFTDSGQSLGNNKAVSVVLADIDNDGDPELITANDNGSVRNKKVWFNDGSGTFTDSGMFFSPSQVTSLAVGDLDGDHDIDILEGITDSNQDTIWKNTTRHPSQAIFVDSEQRLNDLDTRAVAKGDVDGDGDLDIVTANESQGNRVLLNDGNAIFSDSGQSLGTSQTHSIVLADIDGDNDLDIITGNFNNQPNKVWLNDGQGIFADSGQSLGLSASQSIIVADIDNDLDLDLIVGNIGQANRVWRNDGSGNFSQDTTPQSLGTANTYSIAFGDVDNDGDLDFVAGNYGQANQVWLNSGLHSGTFVANQAIGVAPDNTRSISLGDVDGDNDLDLISGNYVTPHQVWINDGTANNMFTGSTAITNAQSTSSILLHDIDGDNDLDLLVANNGQINEVIINGNKGNFYKTLTNGDPMDPTVANNTSSMVLGDFDGDGDIDQFIGNATGEANRVWLNDF